MNVFPDPNVERADNDDVLIDEALEAIRTHLGMPVAYLSRFEDGQSIFRNVSAPGLDHLIKPGDQMALSEIYCPRILSGELPNLIPNTAREPVCVSLPITQAVPIGSHVSLPVILDDGEVYGMFCCLSPEPNPTLNERDLAVMTNFANLVTRQVQFAENDRKAAAGDRLWVSNIIETQAFQPVFQPLVNMVNGSLIGVEALSRFESVDGARAEDIFLAASETGLGIELELATLACQLKDAERLPEDIYLSLNASAELICDPRFIESIPATHIPRLVVEITEHSLPKDEGLLKDRIIRLHELGAKIAIDDVGAGYSGLQWIAKIGPDILKIDRSIVSGVDANISQRAIVAALVHFARETGARVLVEGVETKDEARTLIDLGVEFGQGWLYGKPSPFADLFPDTVAANSASA